MPYTIQRANSVYAEEIARLMQRSIVELCVDDHGSDPGTYSPWLASKTGDKVEKLVNGTGRSVAAFNESRSVVGFAMGTPEGEVVFNYVAPEYRFQGISKALLRDLENYFAACGNSHATLTTTLTAEKFHVSRGYKDTGKSKQHLGHSVKVLRKTL